MFGSLVVSQVSAVFLLPLSTGRAPTSPDHTPTSPLCNWRWRRTRSSMRGRGARTQHTRTPSPRARRWKRSWRRTKPTGGSTRRLSASSTQGFRAAGCGQGGGSTPAGQRLALLSPLGPLARRAGRLYMVCMYTSEGMRLRSGSRQARRIIARSRVAGHLHGHRRPWPSTTRRQRECCEGPGRES
jgi:hypothetical protein